MPKLYDQDFYRWTQETAAALRSGRLAEVDIEHVAEEVEDIGKRVCEASSAVWSASWSTC